LATLECNAAGAVFSARFSGMMVGFLGASSGSGLRTAAGFVTFFAAFVGSLDSWVLALLPLLGKTILTL
jgi:hypothetical protein